MTSCGYLVESNKDSQEIDPGLGVTFGGRQKTLDSIGEGDKLIYRPVSLTLPVPPADSRMHGHRHTQTDTQTQT